MKLQYLGDSKDSFKWDYHDFLLSQLDYSIFNIALMMTPDDGGNDGQSHPSLFPARKEIVDFCHDLRRSRSIEAIKALPEKTGESYEVLLHNGGVHLHNANRREYFSGLNNSEQQVVFLDPDNGFEPEKSCSEKHVAYRDISQLLEQTSHDSVISVFQYFRRKSFPRDFARIRERIQSGHSAAIYWHSLMFVVVSKSETVIQRVVSANENYAKANPVIPIS
jgi:hypothetical protein